MSIPLWFEESLIECAPNEDPKFHRPSKLKNALFCKSDLNNNLLTF